MEQQNASEKNILNTTFVDQFSEVETVSKNAEARATGLEKTESLLATIASNQVLLFEEIKRKNKYEAWKTFFAGIKLVIYIVIIYVSYLGALQLMEQLASGELTKNLIPQINLEDVVSQKSTGNNSISDIIDSLGSDSAGEGADNLISSLLDRFGE